MAHISDLKLDYSQHFSLNIAAKTPTTLSMADPPARKRPSVYQKFDTATKKLRQALIDSLATSYLEHIDSKANDGKCRRIFVSGLTATPPPVARGDIHDYALPTLFRRQ